MLLIIDEFQEFFVEDDRIAQDAALLLDRLVRQGRAFGIHVLLGSQTLGGAYTLARSTIGQMAVRIALQCSEADAHLILSEDNTAARLLTRPGEAIYNDANGLFEGNHPFQVVWLPDDEREHYLERLSALADARHVQPPPPIVFEGNTAADPTKNELLRDCLQPPRPTGPAGATGLAGRGRGHQGSRRRLPPPERQQSADRRPAGGDGAGHAGHVPHQPGAELCGLPAAVAGESPSLDRDPTGETWIPPRRPPPRTTHRSSTSWTASGPIAVGRLLEPVGKQLPLGIPSRRPAAVRTSSASWPTEVERRLEARDARPAALPADLQPGAVPRPAEVGGIQLLVRRQARRRPVDKQFATILREGPNFGVHTLIWCDTFSNLSRWIDRQVLHDLALRVLFQMSANDSANLMDSPEASRLGVHRAMLYNEEQGEFEKFRPYGLPDDAWLRWVREQLQKRVSFVKAES